MNGRIVFRILLAMLVIAALAALGVVVYNAGVAQGVAQSGVLAEEGFRVGPRMVPWVHGWWGGWGFRPFGFGFGFLGCLVPLLFLFLIFALVRGLFWAPWGRWGWRGWGGPGHVPPAFDEWHRRAHGEAPTTAGSPPQEPPAGQ